MATGKRPNVRETCSFLAAATLFVLTASMIPDIHAGQAAVFLRLPLAAGLERRAAGRRAVHGLRALPPRSCGWSRCFTRRAICAACNEHEQTRFNTCFALALFGAIGCAFSDNLLTLYLFYEIVSICTYPLVAHHQDEESYESGKKYLTYLTGTAKGLVLPAMVLIYVLTGNLDFANNINTGILPPDVNRWVVTALYACCILGFAKNGVMPLHSWLPSAMVAPTPVSALLHAVAVVKVGVFSTVRVMLYVFGVDTMRALQPRPADRLLRLHHHRRRLHRRAEQGQPEGAAGLLHRQPALLHHTGRGPADAARHRRRPDPHRQPRLLQDHALLLRRRDLRRHAQEEHLGDERPGAGDALHLRRLRPRLAEHDRRAARRRLCHQVVSAERRL